MNFQKPLKSLLIATVLFSTIPYSRDTQASTVGSIAGSLVLITGTAVVSTALIGIKTYFAYNQSLKQYQLLEEFRNNPSYGYENLKKDARDLYYEQWGASSTSLSSDYPVIWLEKSATSNKNLLGWMIFSTTLTEISQKLNAILPYLRDIQKFQDEKKEYNDKDRQQSYRDEKLAIDREKLNARVSRR